MPRRVVVTFLVPVREHDEDGRGVLHPAACWKALQDSLTRAFGGWTRGETTRGEWLNTRTGNVVFDRARTFHVDVSPARIPEMRRFLRRVSVTFVQECIRVEIKGEAFYERGGQRDRPL